MGIGDGEMNIRQFAELLSRDLLQRVYINSSVRVLAQLIEEILEEHNIAGVAVMEKGEQR